jgi:molybdopterin adenylyltransferase
VTAEDWIVGELVGGLAMAETDAWQVVASHRPSGRGIDLGTAAGLVAIARSVRLVPAARAKWAADQARFLVWMLHGESGNAEALLGEAIAPPAPDAVDLQWRADKLFDAAGVIPAGARDGEEFLVGDGAGGRAWLRVAVRDGRRGSEYVRPGSSPLTDLFDEAVAEACKLGLYTPYDRTMPLMAKVLTISDGVIAGTREDRSGQVLVDRLEDEGYEVVDRRAVADGVDSVAETLADMALGFAGLLVTTGGTGFGPRDLTPEGTRLVLDREALGLAEAMRLANPPKGRLSRGLAGTIGACLVLNTPGSSVGAIEFLEAVLDVLPHALDLLADRHTAHPE